MFNLCKTVKIYQTINHYHMGSAGGAHLVDSHELRYQEALSPSKTDNQEDPALQTLDSHSAAPKRTGISLSIRDAAQNHPSPAKRASLTNSKKDSLRASRTNSSAADSLKLRATRREDCDSPRIVESKITWAEMSPRPRPADPPAEAKLLLAEEDVPLLGFLPLKKEITRTTNASLPMESLRGSDPKIEVEFSPLKRSSFLRSSGRSKVEESMRNSLEYSLRNTLDLKLSTSRQRREEASESLLRLSCSSYSQVPIAQYGCSEFSQSCSLELKKEESFLKEYANDVSQSIILRPGEKEMKYVRSNYDLLCVEAQEFKPTQSNILERECDSPVRRLKKKYGENLLNIYDKETIVSKSITSKSNRGEKTPVIDESIIIRHSVEDRFRPVGRASAREHYRMFLAVEEEVGVAVAIKEVTADRMHGLSRELAVYREIEERAIESAVSRLYQLYTHGEIYVLVKEPHELTFDDFLEKYHADFTLVSWEFIVQAVEQALRRSIAALAAHRLFLARFIASEDLVCTMGEWRLHSPDMFSGGEGEETAIPVEQAMSYLREEAMGRIRARKSQ